MKSKKTNRSTGNLLIGILSAPGLGRITEQEVKKIIPEVSIKECAWMRNHDLLKVLCPESKFTRLFKLRTAQDIFFILQDGVPIRKREDLRKLTPHTLKEEILGAIRYLPSRKKKATTNFFIFVKHDRDSEVYRREIDHTIAQYISANFAKWKNREPADLELWAFHINELVTVGLRLTLKSFRKRSYKEEDRPGSLRPEIAASLVFLSHPEPTDYVLDPMCGTGTILIERGLACPAEMLLGVDSDYDAIAVAKENGERAKLTLLFQEGDSTDLDEMGGYAGRIDTIICNLPFGKQFETQGDLKDLYTRALKCWKKLLKNDGKMILLTSAEAELRTAIKAANLRPKDLATLRVKGLKAYLFEVRR